MSEDGEARRPFSPREYRHRTLTHRFVPVIPDRLEPGVLYLALEYGTATHNCCCGCGDEVVTPLTPTDWRMTYDGDTVSLWPSVGNWNAACRSHYIIDRGRVLPAGDWSAARIAAERRRDRAAKAEYYGVRGPQADETPVVIADEVHVRSTDLLDHELPVPPLYPEPTAPTSSAWRRALARWDAWLRRKG
jgi:hypothetical protein